MPYLTPNAQPGPTPVDVTKPASKSKTIWGAIAALLGAAATLAMVFAGQLGPDAIGPAVVSAGGAIVSIWGRFSASAPIAGVIKTPSH